LLSNKLYYEKEKLMKLSKLILSNLIIMIIIGVSFLIFSGCENKNDGDGYNPHINPSNFSTTINNPFSPMIPGTTFTYEATIDSVTSERTVTEVTHNTKEINGVTCVVIRDRDFVNDVLIEETYDWFAQDNLGNVWYFGELALQMANGYVIGTEGSWEYGVDNAKPGIWMKANPTVGETYRQEFLPEIAQDMVQVLSLTEPFDVPYGSFTNCRKTKEWSELEPGAIEYKYYASGVGLIAVVANGSDQLQLISVSTDTK
jgi:hypothetical protein